jgi:hypothetical protein
MVPIACHLEVFTPEERRAHETATRRLLNAVEGASELADGWELRFAPELLGDFGRWFAEERRCCPFLSLEIALPSGSPVATMRLRGPEGTKALLRAALPALRT